MSEKMSEKMSKKMSEKMLQICQDVFSFLTSPTNKTESFVKISEMSFFSQEKKCKAEMSRNVTEMSGNVRNLL